MKHRNLVDPIDKSDLAALTFFMFLIQGGPATFKEQLDLFPTGPVEPDLAQLKAFVDRLREDDKWKKVEREAEMARRAIGEFVDALMRERLWQDCRTVGLEQIMNIARFA